MSHYFADASGTEMSDARGMQQEMHDMEVREDRARAIADEIAHDEQLSVWSEEMQCRPDLEEFIAYTGADDEYTDGLNCHHAFKAAIRELAEKVIERVLAHQEKNDKERPSP